jgi:hypothetical protein
MAHNRSIKQPHVAAAAAAAAPPPPRARARARAEDSIRRLLLYPPVGAVTPSRRQPRSTVKPRSIDDVAATALAPASCCSM